MGGTGSGRWGRRSTRRTVADVVAIDAQAWRQSGEATGRADVVLPNGEARTIALTAIPSNLGAGRIWYFRCPVRQCGRRVKKLYWTGAALGCRRCLNLTYTTCRTAHRSERLARALAQVLALDPAQAAAVVEAAGNGGYRYVRFVVLLSGALKRIGRTL